MEAPNSHLDLSLKGLRRESLRFSVRNRRSSLTTTQHAFVEKLVEHADDNALDHLNDMLEMFGDGIDNMCAPQTLGSERRKERIEQRKSCTSRSALWKRASLKVVTANRLLKMESLMEDHEEEEEEEEEKEDIATSSVATTEKREIQKPLTRRESTVITDDETSEEEEGVCDTEHLDIHLTNQRNSLQGFGVGEGWEIELEPSAPADKTKIICAKRPQRLLTKRASQNFYNGEGFEVGDEEHLFQMYADQHYDPWTAETDYEGHGFDFHVIGTSAHDEAALPHVLSPPLMHSLQSYLPLPKRGETFWLKYSLVRDGADASTLLCNLRGSTHTLMAIETVEGEVFGAYTGATWSIQHGSFGSGDSFLWRMKGSRAESLESLFDQAKREADIDAFPYSYENNYIQLCQHDRLAVGGGTSLSPREIANTLVEPHAFGFGICFENRDLLHASSSPCLTFRSPSLSKEHNDGSRFEILNLEVWSFTPCISVEEAEIMECRRLFLKNHSNSQ